MADRARRHRASLRQGYAAAGPQNGSCHRSDAPGPKIAAFISSQVRRNAIASRQTPETGGSQVDIAVSICYVRALEVEGLALVGPSLSEKIPFRSIERGCRVQVLVRDNNVDQALKALKKKMQREGI